MSSAIPIRLSSLRTTDFSGNLLELSRVLDVDIVYFR